MTSLIVPALIRLLVVAQLLLTVEVLVLIGTFPEPALSFSVSAAVTGRPPTPPTTTARRSSSTNCDNNEECVQWETYHPETSYWNSSFIMKQDENLLIGTKDQVACRVLLPENDDDDASYYYEFGTVDLSSSSSSLTTPPVCILHSTSAAAVQQQQQHTNFEIAIRNEEHCNTFHWAPMAFDVDPLGPNIVKVGTARVQSEQQAQEECDIGICKYKDPATNDEYIGRMFLQGKYFGHCGYRRKKLLSDDDDDSDDDNKEVMVGGNFEALNAIPKKQNVIQHQKPDEDQNLRRNKAIEEIQKRIRLYLSPQHKQLIESISGHSVEELMKDLNNSQITSYQVLSKILSTDRFIAHDSLNTKGLSILRAVLAEQMTLARRRQFGLHRHPDTAAWERDGVLLKDFDYYIQPANQREFEELLQMVAASQSVSVANLGGNWVERNVTSVPNDPQLEPHIDTFHSVVKMWVYERGVVTNDTGPLHFMRGSNRNTRQKLEWIYNVSLPPATEAIKEPSLRFRGDSVDMADSHNNMDGVLRPVLPLDEYHRTLIIADTSGIHHRGNAVPGTVRRTIRLSSGNDGGLPRQNPYVWDGWDNPTTTKAIHEEL